MSLTACCCFNSLQLLECVCVCVCVCVFVCVTERGGTHMCLHVHMCGLVQLPAVYSADIIGMSTQRWVVLISFPSMPFEQHGNHGGEWIWNKFPMHWCGDDSGFCVWTQAHTLSYTWQTQYSTFIQTSCLTVLFSQVWCYFMCVCLCVELYMCVCVCFSVFFSSFYVLLTYWPPIQTHIWWSLTEQLAVT